MCNSVTTLNTVQMLLLGSILVMLTQTQSMLPRTFGHRAFPDMDATAALPSCSVPPSLFQTAQKCVIATTSHPDVQFNLTT